MGWSRSEITALPLDEIATWMEVAGYEKVWAKFMSRVGRRSAIEDTLHAILTERQD